MADSPISGNRDFRLMIIEQIISILGSALLRFALSLYALDIMGRASIYAALYTFFSIPLLISPVGGVVANHFNRCNLMVFFDFTSDIIISLHYVSLCLGGTSIFLTGAVLIPLSAINLMHGPAATANIPFLVREEHPEGANDLVNGVQVLSNAAAPLIGEMFYDIFGVKALMCVSGTAFICSAVLELFIHVPFRKREFTMPVIPTVAADLKEDPSYVGRNSFISRPTILAFLLSLILTPFFMMGGLVTLRTVMKSTDAMCGIGMGTTSLATTLGALSMGAAAEKIRMENLHRPLAVIALLFLSIAPSVAPAWISHGFYPSYLMFLACATPIITIMTIISIFVITKVQGGAPNENLGGVTAIITVVPQCAAPLGQLVRGFIFQTLPARIYFPTLFICIAVAVTSLAARKL